MQYCSLSQSIGYRADARAVVNSPQLADEADAIALRVRSTSSDGGC